MVVIVIVSFLVGIDANLEMRTAPLSTTAMTITKAMTTTITITTTIQ